MLAETKKLHAAHDEGDAQARAQTVSQVDRLRDADHVAEDDHELVATDAAYEVCRPDVARQALGHLDQQLVAVAVAERVVDQLEAVEVQVEERHVRVVDARPFEELGEVLLAHAAIGEPGQAVVVRLEDEPRLGTFCRVQCLDDTQHPRRRHRQHENAQDRSVGHRGAVGRQSKQGRYQQRHGDDADAQPRRARRRARPSLRELAHGDVQSGRSGPEIRECVGQVDQAFAGCGCALMSANM